MHTVCIGNSETTVVADENQALYLLVPAMLLVKLLQAISNRNLKNK